MTLKQELEQSVIQFQKSRIQKMEAIIKQRAIDGYTENEFNYRFYDKSIIEYFENKDIKVELKYDHFDRDKVNYIILKW